MMKVTLVAPFTWNGVTYTDGYLLRPCQFTRLRWWDFRPGTPRTWSWFVAMPNGPIVEVRTGGFTVNDPEDRP